MGDLCPAHGLLANLPPPALCAADTAYDSNGLRHFLLGRGNTPVIPNNPTRKTPQPLDARAYKARNIIERTNRWRQPLVMVRSVDDFPSLDPDGIFVGRRRRHFC